MSMGNQNDKPKGSSTKEIKTNDSSIKTKDSIVKTNDKCMESKLFEKLMSKKARKIKEILFETENNISKELEKKIIGKSHLIFIFQYNRYGSNRKYMMYVEKKINCYDTYIPQLNSDSFIVLNDTYQEWNYKNIYQEWSYKKQEILLGSKENEIFFSFKYWDEKRKEVETKINKKGEILIPEYDSQQKTIRNYSIKSVRILAMENTEQEMEQEKQREEEDNQTTNKIDRYSMMIISKYFNYINDYIKLEKTCKEYKGIIEQFKYNPIPLKNEKERELFKNIETYHLYSKETSEEEKIIMKDESIKKYIHWGKVSYSYWKENETEKNEYKNVEYGREDMKKYLFDYNDGWKIHLKTEKVYIEERITSFGGKCFEECDTLCRIDIPTTVTSIGDCCFWQCSNLSTINIPESVKSIGEYCFAGCFKLSTINIPHGISFIDDNCFNSCSNLSSINIPSSVSSIGDSCFLRCYNLSTINIPSSVESIGNSCFLECYNLSTITIPSIVSFIGQYCFQFCSNLSTINIPSSVSSLGRLCFGSCSKLSTINIPSSVSEIGNDCFHNCFILNIQMDPDNPIFETNGKSVLRKDDGTCI